MTYYETNWNYKEKAKDKTIKILDMEPIKESHFKNYTLWDYLPKEFRKYCEKFSEISRKSNFQIC